VKNPKYRLFTVFVLATFLLGACSQALTSTAVFSAPTGSEDVLYVNLIWHQHQPQYYKDADGYYTRPWVRVHATKDYYDMAATVAKYPNVHVTFNLTPVLIDQLNDYVNNGAKDEYWVLSEVPASQLTDEQKTFLLTRFFDANWDNMIRSHPGYKRLLDLRGGTTDEAIAKAVETFTEQDFRDLQIWFNLAWIDPDEWAKEPLKTLIEKDHGFDESDKEILFTEVKRIMAEVLPIHKQLLEAGQIEVITTPLAHPILPLIYNSNEAAVGNPDAELPTQFAYVQDAIAQLNQSVEIYKQTFGVAPKGLWPAEGAVSQDIVPLVSNTGYSWMASGEQELAASLGIGSFTRDANDTVLQADQLYRPYFVEGRPDGPVKGGKVMMVFRDSIISDKLGFTYSQTPGKEAAADVIKRLENIRAELKKEGATGPHLVSIILDGENAWEYYPNDGKDFLNALYQELSESKSIKTVTPSEYLAIFPEQESLPMLFSGAWFSQNYDTWIGESEETTAWNYLGKTRKFLAQYESGKVTPPSEEALKQAFQYMYFAEGSDWFWWYGTDQDSGNDAYFDEGFRSLLAKVYETLEQPVPTFLKVPIIAKAVVAANQEFSGSFTPAIDGSAGEGEWDNAAYYPFVGGAQAKSDDVASGFYYGVDSKNLYIRMNAKSDWSSIADGAVGIYVLGPKAEKSNGATLRSVDSEDPFLLGFNASHLIEINLEANKGQLYTATSTTWIKGTAEITSAIKGTILEVAVPLSVFGDLQAGDVMKLAAVVSSGLRDMQALPNGGPGQIILPDLGNITTILDVVDPTGDDHGPGSYTYPTDTVFTPGVFDITEFTVGVGESDISFTFKFAGEVPNSWNSGNNLSLQTLDVYVDKDPGTGTGSRLLLPGRNAALANGNGWDYVVWAEGWTPGIYSPDPSTLEPKAINGADFKIIVDTSKSTVTLRVPRDVFGEGDPSTWGYLAIVMSQDGYPSPGVWRVRDVQAEAAQWKIGGGADGVTNQTRIMDMVWNDASISQEQMLSSFTPSTLDVGSLGPDDFPNLQLLTIAP
jgi:alpha-amylase/alpha-mannosidase (GH57 family)